MASVKVSTPFEAYQGDESYIFVSYSHKDGEIVYPLLKELDEQGYRVWYDEGIDPGNEWPEEIAAALERSSHFLVFLTPNAADSRNVRNEINFAINESKPFLAVHLDEFKLPSGLRLRISDIQAILKWRLSNEEYVRVLRRALPEALRNTVASSLATSSNTPPSHQNRVSQEKDSIREEKTGEVQTVMLPGDVRLELMWCPAGSFMMGSPVREPDRSYDEIQHSVTLTKGFWMGTYPVTQEQWVAVMGSNPSKFKNLDCPVEYVRWGDCQTFCQKLNEMVKGETGNLKFRLPTEAEWEYACRAGTATPFCYGDRLDSNMANFDGNYPYGGASKAVYRGKTTPVGSFQSNAWGLCDMHGNVYEWCSDWYGTYPVAAVVDPVGNSFGCTRVNRGGGWYDLAQDCRSASRGGYDPSYRSGNLGFRLARTLP